jgi:hypothetical protein
MTTFLYSYILLLLLVIGTFTARVILLCFITAIITTNLHGAGLRNNFRRYETLRNIALIIFGDKCYVMIFCLMQSPFGPYYFLSLKFTCPLQRFFPLRPPPFSFLFFFSGEGPRSRRYGRPAAMRLIVQPCDEDEGYFLSFS